MAPVEFEPTISAGESPQTYALDGAATGTGPVGYLMVQILTTQPPVHMRDARKEVANDNGHIK